MIVAVSSMSASSSTGMRDHDVEVACTSPVQGGHAADPAAQALVQDLERRLGAPAADRVT